MTAEIQALTMNSVTNSLRGLAGAVAGGLLGHYAFLWIIQQGFYAVVLPGALLGLGCGLMIQRRSLPLAAGCGVLALLLGIFSEWRAFPYIANDSLGYFLVHLQELRPLTQLLILLGAILGFYLALGSGRKKVEICG